MYNNLKKRGLSLVLALCLLFTMASVIYFPLPVQAAASNLTLSSDSPYLADAFNWAKSMALSKVHSDNGGCYQAALQNRPVYCMRDWAHQVDGAALLGLNNENYNMLKTFANLQTAERKWYSIWEVNYNGTISPIDYQSDTYFWRNLAGMFELVDKAYRQYQWTANSSLLNDSALNNFYTRTLNDFISLHDGNGNGIAEEHSSSGWAGVCSYNEGPDYTLTEAADGLGSQYQAFLAYSKLLAAKGDSTGSAAWNTKATDLKNIFNNNWYSASAGRFIRGFTESSYAPVTDFGYESSWFIPLKELSNPGSPANNYLDFIYNSFNAKPSPNIEAWTYLPDVYYTWNQNDRAWSFLKHIMDSRSDYPEVSFTVISGLATGMMGIQPDAPQNKISTLGRLTSDIGWVQLDHIPLAGRDILVKHENGNNTTTVKLNSGSSGLTWEAEFAGSYPTLYVDGIAQTASQKSVNGTTVSYVNVSLAAGQQKTVSTGNTVPPAAQNLVKNPGFESGTSNWTFTGSSGVASNNPHSGSSLAWLDASASNKVSQNITVSATGNYSLSGWVAAAGSGGVLGIKVNGGSRASVSIPSNTTYNEKSIDNISLNAGDTVEIYVTGSTTSRWINMDDFTLCQSKENLLSNPGFEGGKTIWTFTGSCGTATNNPHSGSSLAWLDGGTSNKVSQTVTVGSSGTYTLSGWTAAAGTGGIFGIKVNGSTRTSVAIPGNTSYSKLTMSYISLNAGDTVEIYITGSSSNWVNIDDFSLTKD